MPPPPFPLASDHPNRNSPTPKPKVSVSRCSPRGLSLVLQRTCQCSLLPWILTDGVGHPCLHFDVCELHRAGSPTRLAPASVSELPVLVLRFWCALYSAFGATTSSRNLLCTASLPEGLSLVLRAALSTADSCSLLASTNTSRRQRFGLQT